MRFGGIGVQWTQFVVDSWNLLKIWMKSLEFKVCFIPKKFHKHAIYWLMLRFYLETNLWVTIAILLETLTKSSKFKNLGFGSPKKHTNIQFICYVISTNKQLKV